MPTRFHLGVAVPATADAAGIMAALATVLAVANDVDTGAPTTGDLTWTRDTTAGSQAIYSNAFGPRNWRIIIAVHDSGTPSPSPQMVASADTYAAANVLIGLCINASGAYAGWNQAAPFTGCTFAGYYRLGLTSGATAGEIRAWSSEKDVWLQYRYGTTTVVSAHAGAVVRGATGYAETDGYRYGLLVSGVGDMSGSWRSSTIVTAGQFGKNGTLDGNAHAGLYIVGGTTWQTIRTSHIRIAAATTNMAKWDATPTAARTALEMQRVLSPEFTVGSWAGVADGPAAQTASIVNTSAVPPVLWGWVLSAAVAANEESIIIGKDY